MEFVALTLGGAVIVLAGALVAVVWRLTQADPRREAEHRFLISALQVARAKSVAEAAQADVIRESARRDEDMEAAVEALASTELEQQRRQGFSGEIAQARALMVKAGLNPDDDADVDLWNARLGTGMAS